MLLIAVSNNQIIHKKRVLTGEEFSPTQIVNEIELLLREIKCSAANFGIAIPGLVDKDGQVVVSDVLPNLNDWKPNKDLEKYGEIFVLNDGDAAMVEVSTLFPTAKTLGVVVVGTGIGAAFMSDGKLLKGEKGWAGEIGYFPVKFGDEYKTLDEIVSGASILKRLNVKAEELITLTEQQDERALRVIKDSGLRLGANLAGLINAFNFSALILTGGTFRWSGYKESVLAEIKKLTIPNFLECCELVVDMEFENLVINGVIKTIK